MNHSPPISHFIFRSWFLDFSLCKLANWTNCGRNGRPELQLEPTAPLFVGNRRRPPPSPLFTTQTQSLHHGADHGPGRPSSCSTPTWSPSPSSGRPVHPVLHSSKLQRLQQVTDPGQADPPEAEFPHHRPLPCDRCHAICAEPAGLPRERCGEAQGFRGRQEGAGHWLWWSCHRPGRRVRLLRFVASSQRPVALEDLRRMSHASLSQRGHEC